MEIYSPYIHFGDVYSDITLDRSVSGMGAGGIAITSINFSVPRSAYNAVASVRAPLVRLILTPKGGGSIKLPDFYVDSRAMTRDAVKFTAYDRLAFADGVKLTVHDVGADEGTETITAAEIVDIIAAKLELDGWSNKEGAFDALGSMTTAELVGSTCSSVLTSIAAVLMGFWCVSNDNILVFSTWYANIDEITYACKDCTLPDIGDTLTITEYIADDSSGNEFSYSLDKGGILLQADSGNLIRSKEAAKMIGQNMCGRTYTYGKVDKALIDHIPELNTQYSFADGDALTINNISAVISCGGIVAQLSANSAGGNEIGASLGEISRRLEQVIKIADRDGSNIIHTRYQGDIQVDSDEYEKYLKGEV